MKKQLRLISLVLALLIACFAFCGCDALDEMRKTHAVWMDEEQTVISLNGKEYKLLPECNTLAPNEGNDISLTEGDVPLLLADMFSDYYANLSEDEDFIVVDPYDGYTQYFDKESETRNYCVSNRYDEICNRINETIIDYYCYDYDEFDAEVGYYITKRYCLTLEEVDAVLTVRKGEIAETVSQDIDELYNNADYNLEIYQCSEDTIFRTYAFDLVFKNQKAYIVNDYGEYTDAIGGSYRILVVPDEDYSIFCQIASKYIESMEEW